MHKYHPFITPLEPRLLFAVDPTANEQYLLELINRARANPQAEIQRLLTSPDPDIRAELAFYGVNKSLAVKQFNNYPPVPPLAWSRELGDEAAGHNSLLVQKRDQQYTFPNEPQLYDRVTAAGYTPASGVGVSNIIYGFAQSPLEAHATFLINWADVPNGMYSPPFSRLDLLSNDFRHIGISFKSVPKGSPPFGPNAITETLSAPADTTPILLGVAYNDGAALRDAFYTPGEGYAHLTLTATRTSDNATFTTTTTSSGGYSLPLPAGTYNLSLTGGTLKSPLTQSNVAISSANVKVDFATAAPAKPGTLPDLAVTVTQSPPGSIPPSSKTLPVAFTITNKGPAYTGPVNFTLYFSKDKKIDASDISLPTVKVPVVKLAAKSSRTFPFNAAPLLKLLPTGGRYFFLVDVQTPTDTNPKNNTASSKSASNVLTPTTNLTPSFSGKLTPNPAKKNLPFTLLIKNTGNTLAKGTATLTLSARPTTGGPDVLLKTFTGIKLNTQPNATQSLSKLLPTSPLPPGPYKLIATLTPTLSTPESKTTDNTTTSSPFTLK